MTDELEPGTLRPGGVLENILTRASSANLEDIARRRRAAEDALRAVANEEHAAKSELLTKRDEIDKVLGTPRPSALESVLGATLELNPDATIPPTIEPGIGTTEYTLADWTVKLGGKIAWLGGLLVTISGVGGVAAQLVDGDSGYVTAIAVSVGAIGAAAIKFGLAIAGRQTEEYGKARTARKIGGEA